MKLTSIVFAIPWLLVLAGLSEIYFGAFAKLTGSDLEVGVRLFNIAGILVGIGGLLGLLLAITGWAVGNKAMMIHGLIAVAAGAFLAAKVLTGPANTNYHTIDQPTHSDEPE